MADALTIDQQKALAIAQARMRMAQSEETVTNYGPDKIVVRKPVPPDEEGGYLAAAGTGLRRLGEGLGGMAGDIPNAVMTGAGALAKKLGQDPAVVDREVAQFSHDNPLPTSAGIREATTPILGPEYEPRSFGEKALSTGMQFLPAMFAGGGNLVTRALTNVAAPAVATETAGAMTHDNPYARMIAALLAPAGAGRLLSPFPASAERQAMVQTLANEGVGVTAGQATGQKFLRALEEQTGGGAARAKMEQQGEQFSAAALRKAGINADRATPATVLNARDDFGREYENLIRRTGGVDLDQQMASDLITVVDRYKDLKGVHAAPRIDGPNGYLKRISDAAHQNGGRIPADVYSQVRSDISKDIRNLRGSDPTLEQTLRDFQDALYDSIGRNAAPGIEGAWRDLNNRYRNFKIIEKSMMGAGEATGEGLITPAKLRSAVERANPEDYVAGKGDFADLARAGTILKPLADSGTAINTQARNLGAGFMSILGSGAGAMHSPEAAMAGALLGGIAPAAAGRALMSRPVQGYLANQAAVPMDMRTQALISALLARPAIQGP